ncbi:TrkH family potassium uptake protein [Mariprofundus ferrooxydans]|uniref:TrkH family potassium uptake protein n=1 Tax=Mariprofundus ferrooxydans TaxID=314344 RepID=UPI001430497C|nr:TrkH family potassium uptake protein [Mariprofundus ferrooxydans]
MNQHTMAFLRPIMTVMAFVLMMGAALCVPSISLVGHEGLHTAHSFIYSAIAFAVTGAVLFLIFRAERFEVSSQQLYLITVFSWLLFALIGSIPLYFGLHGLSFTDAFFESISGITTTGSTVLERLDTMPRSILLWRGILQWIGGIGVIVVGIAILPYLRVGGMRMFSTESSDWSDKTLHHAQTFIQNISLIYFTFTLLACLLYWLAGMSLFDAVVHSMTTLSTGGYANHDSSMGYFNDYPLILWISSVFMLLGSLPFSLFVGAAHGKWRELVHDSQVRGFIVFVTILILLFSIERTINSHLNFFQVLTHVTFNVVSVITTTGYASDDYSLWGPYAVIIFFYIMFVGGCSGSTAGSMKFFRFQVAFILLRNQLHLMRHPSAVYPLKYNGRLLSDDIVRSIVAFSFYFVFTIAAIALFLSLTGLDFITSLSAAATAVTNVGPGLGETVGPAGNFSSLSDAAKWILCAGMLIGRLEIMTVIVVFTRTFWRI